MGQPKVGSPISFNTDSPLAVAGICLAIGANLIISAGLNGQKWVHNQNERLPEAERQPYTKQSLWWLGLIGTVLGEVLNFLAFGFAGAAIVTPLGAVCVVANEVIACAFLGEQFRVRDLFGVTCTVAGSVLVVIAAPVTERDMAVGDFVRLASGAVFLSYMVCVLLALVAIWRLLPKVQHKHPAWGLTLCSLLGTLTVLSATALSNFVRLTASGRSQFGSVVPYVLLLVMVPSAIGQVRYLNETMERFDNTTVRARRAPCARRPGRRCPVGAVPSALSGRRCPVGAVRSARAAMPQPPSARGAARACGCGAGGSGVLHSLHTLDGDGQCDALSGLLRPAHGERVALPPRLRALLLRRWAAHDGQGRRCARRGRAPRCGPACRRAHAARRR